MAGPSLSRPLAAIERPPLGRRARAGGGDFAPLSDFVARLGGALCLLGVALAGLRLALDGQLLAAGWGAALGGVTGLGLAALLLGRPQLWHDARRLLALNLLAAALISTGLAAYAPDRGLEPLFILALLG